MSQKAGQAKPPAETVVKEIRRTTRKHYSAEEKIHIVLEDLRRKDSIAELCRREDLASNIYYRWSKDFLEAGKKRLAGDVVREATLPRWEWPGQVVCSSARERPLTGTRRGTVNDRDGRTSDRPLCSSQWP